MTSMIRTIFSQKFIFYTNTLGSGLLMCVGDTIQQSVEMYTRPNKQGYDLERICHMGLIGLLMGPPQHFFYKYLDKFLPRKSIKSIAKKICLDQAIISPTCIIIFLGGLGYLEKKPREDITAEIEEKFLLIYSTDWMLWPPCQYVNFTYVKAKYRVMYVNVITVIYDVILSYIKHTDDLFGKKAVQESSKSSKEVIPASSESKGNSDKSKEESDSKGSSVESKASSDKVVKVEDSKSTVKMNR